MIFIILNSCCTFDIVQGLTPAVTSMANIGVHFRQYIVSVINFTLTQPMPSTDRRVMNQVKGVGPLVLIYTELQILLPCFSSLMGKNQAYRVSCVPIFLRQFGTLVTPFLNKISNLQETKEVRCWFS